MQHSEINTSLTRAIPFVRSAKVPTYLLLCCILLTSCVIFPGSPTSHTSSASSSPSSSTTMAQGSTVDHPVKTTGCGRAAPLQPDTSADEEVRVNPAEALGQHTRTYRLHVPLSYQINSPQALVLVFHGYGGNAAGMESGTGFSQFADQHDFIVVYPQGLPDGDRGAPFWASIGPMDYGVDDVAYVSAMLNDLQSTLCIDAQRIFVTGFSNGGGESGLLACRLAGRIAAVAPISGNFYALPGGCHPARPLPLLYVHGSADPLLPYQGIPSSEDAPWPLPPVQQWLQEWATRDGCQTGPTVFLHTSQAMGERWTACQGAATVIHYRIEGGGHAWPKTLGDKSGIAAMWDFFHAHPLPTF